MNHITNAYSLFHLPHTTGVPKTAMMVRSVAAHSPQLGHKLQSRDYERLQKAVMKRITLPTM